MIDQALLTELQYALLEPPDGGQSWPSGIWTREEVIDAVNSGERDLLRRAHLLVTRTEFTIQFAFGPSFDLPSDWLATAQITYRTFSGERHPLAAVDVPESDFGLPTWLTEAGLPYGYIDSDQDTLTFRLVPRPADFPAIPPIDSATIELLYIAVPTPVNGNGREFTVPDDYLVGVKYSALGMLLRKVGRLQDPERAAYCEQRAEMAVVAAEMILGGWA